MTKEKSLIKKMKRDVTDALDLLDNTYDDFDSKLYRIRLDFIDQQEKLRLLLEELEKRIDEFMGGEDV
jgi:hypothetical protein